MEAFFLRFAEVFVPGMGRRIVDGDDTALFNYQSGQTLGGVHPYPAHGSTGESLGGI